MDNYFEQEYARYMEKHKGGGSTATLNVKDMARHFYNLGQRERRLPKWERFKQPRGCWAGEIRADPTNRKFVYENYSIDADKLFELLEKDNQKQ